MSADAERSEGCFHTASSLARMGVLAQGEDCKRETLSGGVSCDVWLITKKNGERLVLKRALPKLRVTAEWCAPAERSHTEVDWLRLVAEIDPKLVPKVLSEDRVAHAFAMEFLPSDRYPLWKEKLAAGDADPGFAARTGNALAQIHAATATNAHIAHQFANQAQFLSLRIEPYLLYVSEKHRAVAPIIRALARSIADSRIALMQGDISPKNILCGPDGPVFLDAETACYGDPAFDLAFCGNHLLLKCIWHPEFTSAYLACFGALSSTYLDGVSWENSAAIEARAAALIPALLLARIDGKSPVEYITDGQDKIFVRRFAKQCLAAAPHSLTELRALWANVCYSR
jgi:aminoglycoside phosphotransferase (APT) family kinase protein